MPRPRKASSIQQIAKEAGVSISTVSRVLNNRPEVSDEARRKVRGFLERNAFVAAPISTRRLSVGVVLPMEAEASVDIYYSLALEGVANYALANDIEATLIFHCEGKGAPLVEKLRARGCQSAILLNSDKLEAQAAALSESGMAIILLNGRWKLPRIGYIDCDSFDAGLKLGRHLAALGHRRVGILQNVPVKNHLERARGVETALREAFGKDAAASVHPFISAKYVPESGFLQALKALREEPLLTALVGINDQVAYGAVGACAKLGLRIPEQVSVAGFDDYPLSASYNPPLTSVRQPIVEMGRLAAECAGKAIGDASAGRPPQIIMPVELVERDSTAKARS